MIAAGVGCRRQCTAQDVVAAVRAALSSAGRELAEVSALYAPVARSDAPALREAAALLGKALELVAIDRLAAQSPRVLTRSARVQASLGVPSAAETAALAGACGDRPGVAARLLGPRTVAGSATCALAVQELPP